MKDEMIDVSLLWIIYLQAKIDRANHGWVKGHY